MKMYNFHQKKHILCCTIPKIPLYIKEILIIAWCILSFDNLSIIWNICSSKSKKKSDVIKKNQRFNKICVKIIFCHEFCWFSFCHVFSLIIDPLSLPIQNEQICWQYVWHNFSFEHNCCNINSKWGLQKPTNYKSARNHEL